jgi:integrase/recombinase XerD
MLEEYFVKPQTIDRIRGSWIGPQVEQYVTWLAGKGYESRSILRRVPLVVAFGEFARANGARQAADLPGHVSAFVGWRVSQSRDALCAEGEHARQGHPRPGRADADDRDPGF